MIPNAMGFSPDSRRLGIVYGSRFILVDVTTGKETKRIKRSAEFNRVNYNYVAFEPSGRYCAIGEFGRDEIDLQFIDIEHGIGSKLVNRVFPRTPADPSDYQSYGYHLPLRQWLAFHETEASRQGSFPVTFSSPESHDVETLHVSVTFEGHSSLQKAEQIYEDIRPTLRPRPKHWDLEEAKKYLAEVGRMIGSGMQVALSQDERLLLTQSVSGDITWLRYRFRFYDTKSKELIAEISIPTGIDWRFNGSRGFAFSREFRYLARTNPGGVVIVHDLSKLVDRTLDGNRSIELPFRVPRQ